MSDEAELRRRFQLGAPPVSEFDETTDPALAQEARRLLSLSRRFGLGLAWSDCIRKAKEARHEHID